MVDDHDYPLVGYWSKSHSVESIQQCVSPAARMVSSFEAQWQPASPSYPLVNRYVTMENHNFSWLNQLFPWPFSTASTINGNFQELCDINYQRLPGSQDITAVWPWTLLAFFLSRGDVTGAHRRSPSPLQLLQAIASSGTRLSNLFISVQAGIGGSMEHRHFLTR